MNAVSILVVEDESIVAMDIRNCLAGHGYRVVGCVPSGEEAIAMVAESRPDLVLMDIRLQGEMNGIEAARRIMESFQGPSLFLTSYVDREMLAQAKGLNAVGYVLKPFEDRELGVAVEMALHRWQVEAGLRQALRQATGGKDLAAGRAPEAGVPLLQIRTLGRMEFLLGDRVVAKAEDLSRSLRNLLGLLMTSPQMRVSKDDIQLALWPESPPEKARSSFDSLLLRLRKTVENILQPQAIANYIVLQRGILCLNNCQVDAVEFLLAARRGLELMKKKNPAAAKAAFTEALQWWSGPFLPGASEIERLHDFKEKLDHLYIEVVLGLSELLLAEGEHETASRILSQALPSDRANDDLVRALHQCYLAANNPAKAGEVVRQYEESLWRAGFSPKEIRKSCKASIPD
jgi:DNA-binding response OmpR family regulator